MKGTAMNIVAKAQEIRHLLLELRSLLEEYHESNWIRGIEAAIGELSRDSETLSEIDVRNARSIYKTMNEGGRGFAENFVWLSNEDDRIAVNKKLDVARAKLWKAFDM